MSEILFQHEEQVQAFFAGINNRDVAAIEAALEEMTSSEAVRALLMLKEEDRTATLELIGPTFAADLVEEIPTEQAAEMAEYKSKRRALQPEAMDAADVAGQVVDAIRAQRFYVITHPESLDQIRARFDRILAGENPQPPIV